VSGGLFSPLRTTTVTTTTEIMIERVYDDGGERVTKAGGKRTTGRVENGEGIRLTADQRPSAF